MRIQRSEERGESDLGWLQSKFSFSFAEYYNPDRIGFGKLIVLNDDIIAPATGFGAHAHNNMEIITIPLHGELTHKDSTGKEEVIIPGQVQVMSAGTGIVHSEYNNSPQPLKLFQIWIEPEEWGVEPRHDTRSFVFPKNELVQIVSGTTNEGLYIHQDARIFWGNLEQDVEFKTRNGHGAFLMIVEGRAVVNGNELNARDSLESTTPLSIKTDDATVLIIEVPA